MIKSGGCVSKYCDDTYIIVMLTTNKFKSKKKSIFSHQLLTQMITFLYWLT